MDGHYCLDTESIALCPLEEGNNCKQAGSLAKVYCSLFFLKSCEEVPFCIESYLNYLGSFHR